MDQVVYDLGELESRSQDHVMGFSDWISDRLDEKAASMVNASMSDNEYIKLNELYYRKYRYERNNDPDNKDLNRAMKFCILRVQQITSYKKQRRNRSLFPLLKFSKKMDENTVAFLNGKKNLYLEDQMDFKKKILLIASIVTVLIMALLVLLYKINFFIGWLIATLIGVILYCLSFYIGFNRYFEYQMEQLYPALDKTHRTIDKNLKNG
ncbi:MAG: hypothetical protein HUJ53_09210 [Holdemanella sp.]|nr:hypothetical protein [Holdemanella sp.]